MPRHVLIFLFLRRGVSDSNDTCCECPQEADPDWLEFMTHFRLGIAVDL